VQWRKGIIIGIGHLHRDIGSECWALAPPLLQLCMEVCILIG
jgi:hypothetical protein